MTNGTLLEDQPGVVQMDGPEPAPLPRFDLSRLTYGDLRRLQTVDATNADGLALLDGILEKAVVGGLDAIPIVALKGTVTALMEAITEAMSGKDEPA
jgi:hypothetical protein